MKKNKNFLIIDNKLTSNNKKKNFKKEFLMWFLGFCDAEANFQTFPKRRLSKNGEYYNIGYGFHLGIHSDDKDIINKIHNFIELRGKLYEYHTQYKDEIRLCLTKLEDLHWFINNIMLYPLLTKHQWERFCRLKYGVLNRVSNLDEYHSYITNSKLWLEKKPELEEQNLIENWIIGFINGEGTFSVDKKKKLLIFYIEQTEKEVLELIKKRLNFTPNILFRPKRKDTYSLFVSSKKDIKTLITFLNDKNLIGLQGKKKEQFKLWLDYYQK